MGDWAAQEWSAHARMGRLAGGAGRLGKNEGGPFLFFFFLLFSFISVKIYTQERATN
jgi:hypothetical protein